MANQIPGWVVGLAVGFVVGGIVFTSSGRKLVTSAAGAGAKVTSAGINRVSTKLEGI